MLKDNLILDTILEKNIPVELARSSEVILSHDIVNHDALLHIANPSDYMMGIGKRGVLDFYDIDKLKADGIYIHKRNYGGSGSLFGPKDIVFSLHVNKNSFIDEYQVLASEAYKYFNQCLYYLFEDLGVEVEIDETKRSQAEDGVCIHLQGRSEIITTDGRKMAVSVYREDDIGFYMNGAILISDAWSKIYNYLLSPVKKQLPVNSVEMILGQDNLTAEVMELLGVRFGRLFQAVKFMVKSPNQIKAIQAISHKYRIG